MASTACAYLLRLTSTLHQCHHRYVPQQDYIAGKANVMANNASCWWDLSDMHLLSRFDTIYPQATSSYALEVAASGSRNDLRRDWGAVTAVLHSHCSSHSLRDLVASTWRVWERFCTTAGVSPDLQDFFPGDPVPLLLLFAHPYRSGRIAPARLSAHLLLSHGGGRCLPRGAGIHPVGRC